MCDPTIRQPGFDLPRQQWSLLNRFRTEQGHCSARRRKWRLTDTDLCPCGKTKTMSHIVESCPLTKLNGGFSRLHSADEDAVSWLTMTCIWEEDRTRVCYNNMLVVMCSGIVRSRPRPVPARSRAVCGCAADITVGSATSSAIWTSDDQTSQQLMLCLDYCNAAWEGVNLAPDLLPCPSDSRPGIVY